MGAAGGGQGLTGEGALAQAGTAVPQILEITAVTPQGLSLKVDYDPDSGLNATVLELLWKVNGAPADYLRVAANKTAGNVIGPFTAGQVIALRTDVGNSRDVSELGPEQTVMIT